ncbi:hypothetical protein [uncultured Polaribacter sp.]|uniref:hypothetical protein n=1 Tax=uncultured Polaribacter sp. TaxID=174711 RepID=UPI002624FE03|nr:hypothetical protein [uncultured Polaribacter sp.]
MNKKIIFSIVLSLIFAIKLNCQTLTQGHISQKELNQVKNIKNYFDLNKIKKFGWSLDYETEKIDSIGIKWFGKENLKGTIYSFGNPLKLNYKDSFKINFMNQNSNINIWKKPFLLTKNNEFGISFKISNYEIEFENSNFKCQSFKSLLKKKDILSSKSIITTSYDSHNVLQFSTKLGLITNHTKSPTKCFVGNSNIIVSISSIRLFDFSYYSNYENKYFFDINILRGYSDFFNNHPFNFFKDLSAITTRRFSIQVPFNNSNLKSNRGRIVFNNNIVLCQFFLEIEKKVKEDTFEIKLSNDEIVAIKIKKLKKHLKKLGLKNVAVNFEQLFETSRPRIKVEFLLNKEK